MSSADDLYDPDVFEFEFPVWCLSHKTLSFLKTLTCVMVPEDDRAVPIFTDRDLLQSFIASNPHTTSEFEEWRLEQYEDLEFYLSEAEKNGVKHVAFDPIFTATRIGARYKSIADIRKIIRRGIADRRTPNGGV